jgi:hypothetical protein
MFILPLKAIFSEKTRLGNSSLLVGQLKQFNPPSPGLRVILTEEKVKPRAEARGQ